MIPNKLPFITKKKKPTVEYIGNNSQAEISIQSYNYNIDECEIQNYSKKDSDAICAIDVNSDKHILWLNFHGMHDSEFINTINSSYGIHRLVTQNILNSFSRPKIEIFDNLLVISIQCIYDNIEDTSEFVSEQISFVLGENSLLSYQEKPGDHFNHIRERIKNNYGLVRQKKSDFLLYLLLESIIIHYAEIIFTQNTAFEFVNTKILTNSSPKILEEIEDIKQKLVKLKNAISPINEDLSFIIKETPIHIKKENIKYYKELKNRASKNIDEINELTEKINSSINLYFSVQGHKMNEIMKTLTVVSTIFIPITFVAGVYGMNFVNIPELRTQNGYFIFWAGIATIVILLLYYFKRKNWF